MLVVAGGYLVSGRGRHTRSEYTDSVELLWLNSPAAWEYAAPLPLKLGFLSGAAIGSSFFVVGGSDDDDITNPG